LISWSKIGKSRRSAPGSRAGRSDASMANGVRPP
jgi:hypothetical protein